MQFFFCLQDQLTFIIDANADAGDGLIGQLKSDRSSRQYVVTIGFGECQSGMGRQLSDSKIETLQDFDQDGGQIERLPLKIKPRSGPLRNLGRCAAE